jgi:hypothetical protein
LDDAYNDEHGNMHTSSYECAASNRYDRSKDETPSSTNLIRQRATSERAYACSKQEQDIDGTQDVVRVVCFWTSSSEIGGLEETWPAEAGCE